MQPDHCLLGSTWVARACVEAKSLDFWEQRAIPMGLSRNPGPLPKRMLPTLASVFCCSPCPLPETLFSWVSGASQEIQALGSLLSLASGCFLGVLHVLFDSSLCPLLACAEVPCHCPAPPRPAPHFRAVHTVSVLLSLSLFGCIALCNSVGLPLSGLFFFLDSCRLFIVVPKACRCGVKYIVQIPVSSASLMLELSPLTLCWPLMLMCIFIMFVSFFVFSFFFPFFFPFCAAKLVLLERLLKGKYLNLHLNIKKSIFLELHKITTWFCDSNSL